MEKEEFISHFYKEWCKATKRSGSVLVGSSIKGVLTDFFDYIQYMKDHPDRKQLLNPDNDTANKT